MEDRLEDREGGIILALENTLQSFTVARKKAGIEQAILFHLTRSSQPICRIEEISRRVLDPKRVARDGCGLPTVSNTVNELAKIYAGLVRDKDELDLGSNVQTS